MIVDRDGGRSPGELRGEKAVGRVEAPLIHLGPWEPRRLRRREGRRLATEAPAFLAPVVAEVVVERVDVASALLAEVVREIGVAPPVARGALGVRVLPVSVSYFVGCRRVEGVGRDSRPVLYGRRNREP